MQFYYKDIDEPESELSDDEKAQLCKRVALARRKKTKASDEVWQRCYFSCSLPSPAQDISLLSTACRPEQEGLGPLPRIGNPHPRHRPCCPNQPELRYANPYAFSQEKRRLTFGICLVCTEQAPPPYEAPALDHTLSGEIYSSLLSNPRLSDEHREAVAAMQSERAAAGGQDDDLTQYLSRTESRKSLAKQRRELEILQALGPPPADPHQLTRTPSAAARDNQAELARLEAGSTQDEIASVEAEIMRLKAELGLEDRV